MISKTEIVAAEFYHNYINLAKEEEIGKALEKNTAQFRKFLKKIPKKKIDHAYAKGKWTIREMLQHIIDAERVFVYRALTFSRFDATVLPGFDENTWAIHSGAAARGWGDMIEEFKLLRKSTVYFFATLTEAQLKFTGEANGRPLNALALGFILPGHVAHHMNILKERYL